jgi:hypothetical protein
MRHFMSWNTWIDRSSISVVLLYVTYDAYAEGRPVFALAAAAFLIVGMGVELAGRRGK